MDDSDEATIDDHESLLRRARPLRNCIGTDLETGRRFPLPGALVVDPDGVSVYRQYLLEAKNLGPHDLCKLSDHHVFRFTALCVRSAKWEALYSPDDTDKDVGFAHSSLVTKVMPPSKVQKMALREAVAAEAELVYEPGSSAPSFIE